MARQLYLGLNSQVQSGNLQLRESPPRTIMSAADNVRRRPRVGVRVRVRVNPNPNPNPNPLVNPNPNPLVDIVRGGRCPRRTLSAVIFSAADLVCQADFDHQESDFLRRGSAADSGGTRRQKSAADCPRVGSGSDRIRLGSA